MTKRPMDPTAELKPSPPIEDADVVDRPGPPSYEEEIEAEQRGTTAERIEQADDLDDEPDAAHRPDTG